MKKMPKIAKSHLANLSLAVAMATTTCLLQAEDSVVNLLKNGGAETGDVSSWDAFQSVSSAAKEGKHAFVLGPKKQAISDDFIELDPEAQYEISCFAVSQQGGAKWNIGFDCYDAEQKRILSEDVTIIEGTETALTEEAVKGSKVLKIANGQSWAFEPGSSPKWGVVAFNVDDSGAFSDLPNRERSDWGITAIRQVDGQWEVELKNPLRTDYPAGTKVRQHKTAGTCMWIADPVASTEWTQTKGRRSGVSMVRGDSGKKFWPGTRFVKIFILNQSDSDILFDDIIFRRLE
jgi:hypothetical protein